MAQPLDEAPDLRDAPESNRPGIFTVIILIILLLAMLISLLWPLLQQPAMRHRMPATPTPLFLREA